MNIYCDEAGYTGRNLLSIDQPWFVYSALHLSSVEIESIMKIINANYPLQGGEIKGKNIVQSTRGQKAILEIFRRFSKNARIVFHDKKYVLAVKIVEYCVEPFLISNQHFYETKLNIFIASKLYSAFMEKNNSAETLFNDFENIVKGKLAVEDSILGSLEADHEIVDWILKIVNSATETVKNELKGGTEKVDKWMLELTTTSLLALLSDWYKHEKELTVYCDNSLIFLNNPVFEGLNKIGLTGKRISILNSEIGFKLKGEIKNVDSKENIGIQLADLFSSTIYYCLNIKEKTEFTQRILSYAYQNSICRPETACMIAEDLTSEEFQINKGYYYEFMEYIQIRMLS